MKSGIIVYYSRTEKTRFAAEILSENLQTFELFQVLEKNFSRRNGIFGFIKSGYDAVFNNKIELVRTPDLSKYEILLFCGPIWAGKIAPPVRQIIIENSVLFNEKKIFILTTSDSKTGISHNYFKKKNIAPVKSLNLSSVPKDKNSVREKFGILLKDFAVEISQ